MNLSIPKQELITSGHCACQGCGAMLAMRYILKALGEKTILTIPACCQIVTTGPVTNTNLKVPMFACAFAAAASTASGIKAGLVAQGKNDIHVAAFAGDGGTFDIGLQALSAAAERHDDIFYFCYDNEGYMNTGRQKSSATPLGAHTMTTPELKKFPKKDIIEIMAAHKIEYIATLSLAYPEDFIRKVEKGATIKGTKFFHILSPCPSGWQSKTEDTIKLSKLAIESCIFPLLEIENGEKLTINRKVTKKIPVEQYLKLQGRFKFLSNQQLQQIQTTVDNKWQQLLSRCCN